ncbi:MAG: TRAP transporter substrate-binding protein DctP [Lachnospiraceae bacterium]|nr:TRAP transporter substrate-binding protein DctP [Lachnospiraceae bacterium]
MKERLAAWICAILLVTVSIVGCAGKEEAQGNSNDKADEIIKTEANGESEQSAKGQVIELRASHTNPASSMMGVALEEFAEKINEKTEGRYHVTVYHDGQLGDERDNVEGIQLGNLDIAIVNASVLGNFVPKLGVFDLPYVIQGTEHADEVFMGKIGDDAMGWVEEAGVKGLGIWESGFRNLTNSRRPINTIDDVAGLRIRVMENEIHQKLWIALGADAVPMAWGETYTALQQGALDGQENPTSVILANNVQEVNKNLAMTEHIYSIVVPIMSVELWNSMSQEDQKLFQEAADEMRIREREIAREMAEEAVGSLKEAGMDITYPDKKDFIEATKEIRDTYGAEYAEILAEIEALAK